MRGAPRARESALYVGRSKALLASCASFRAQRHTIQNQSPLTLNRLEHPPLRSVCQPCMHRRSHARLEEAFQAVHPLQGYDGYLSAKDTRRNRQARQPAKVEDYLFSLSSVTSEVVRFLAAAACAAVAGWANGQARIGLVLLLSSRTCCDSADTDRPSVSL